MGQLAGSLAAGCWLLTAGCWLRAAGCGLGRGAVTVVRCHALRSRSARRGREGPTSRHEPLPTPRRTGAPPPPPQDTERLRLRYTEEERAEIQDYAAQ